MEEEKDVFYVVKKGDIIGIYNSLSDWQAQAGPSVNDPSVIVFKGYSLSKEAENHLVSLGLKNASYSMSISDVHNDLFGSLVSCRLQEPSSLSGIIFEKYSAPKISQEAFRSTEMVSTSVPTYHNMNYLKTGSFEAHATSPNCSSCTLEFDGASRGNPGPAGAGAVLRAADGSMVCRFREGLGITTNNVAEYRAVILGLKQALSKGFKNIIVQGDSNLVCMQIQGLWKIKNQNLAALCMEARELKDRFMSFEIKHIRREFNSEADAQANLAVILRDGQVEEDFQMK